MSAASGQRISAGFGQGMSATRGQLMSASEEGLLMSVVVGVDGSAASRMAIRVAAQEARYRQAPLIAVLAYSGERTLGAPAAQPLATLGTGGDQRGAAESQLRDLVTQALGSHADQVQLELRVVAGIAGRQIIEAAREARAQLIVLATRGSMSMLLGTVSQYVLRKAPCPVLIVPAGASPG
jgi:nucleotide-binding universal stress UspA family protein